MEDTNEAIKVTAGGGEGGGGGEGMLEGKVAASGASGASDRRCDN